VRRARKGHSRLPEELRPDNRRIESFSDAVFAIVVTIMVLEISIPDSLAVSNDPAALSHFAGLIITYALSFVVVGILWASHHYLVYTLPGADRTTIWLNNLVLFWVTLIPIVARFFGMHPTSARAAAAYAFVIMMNTVAFSILRAHASNASHNELHRAIHRRVFRKAWIGIALYAAAIPLAFVSIKLAWILLASLPALFFLPVVRRGIEWGMFPHSVHERLVHGPEGDG
jgi:TMEM175 potassium channel family protein